VKDRKEELLVCLAEECSEVIKCVTKIQRFGDNRNNEYDLQNEVGDIMGVVKMLITEHPDLFQEDALMQQAERKIEKLNRYMTHKKS
jgi:NTP pyrophosphatase (non-canonical NTP hydrolase)